MPLILPPAVRRNRGRQGRRRNAQRRPPDWASRIGSAPEPLLYLDGRAGIVPRSAVALNGVDQFLSVANDPALQTGSVDFFFAAWVLRLADDVLTIACKQPAPADREWILGYSTTGAFTTDRFFFRVAGAGDDYQATANAFGAWPIGEWAFVLAWRDLAAGTINIRINDGPIDSALPPGGITNTTAPLILGASQDSLTPTYNRFFNGLIDQPAFGKPAAIGTTIDAIHATLYNGGNGVPYADLSEADKTTFGLLAFWELAEDSGNRIDAHGSFDLIPSGSPTNGPGLASDSTALTDGTPVSSWDSRTGGFTYDESNALWAPTYVASRESVLFDGIDDRLDSDAPILGSEDEFTVLAEIRARSLPITGKRAAIWSEPSTAEQAINRLLIGQNEVVAEFQANGSPLVTARAELVIPTDEALVLGVIKTSNELKLLANGYLVGSAAIPDDNTDMADAVSRVGGPDGSADIVAFHGEIPWLKGWGLALSNRQAVMESNDLLPLANVPSEGPAEPFTAAYETHDDELISNVRGGGVPYANEHENKAEVYIAKGPSLIDPDSTTQTTAVWATIPADFGFRSERFTVLSIGEVGGDSTPCVIDFDHDRNVRFTIRRPGDTNPSITQSVAGVLLDGLNLIVAVRDGADLKISVNGAAFLTNTNAAGLTGFPSNATWIHGNMASSYPHNAMLGGAHRVMTWDHAFDASDVTALFNAGIEATADAPPVANPTAWLEPLAWRFEDVIGGRSFRYDHFPLTGFARPSDGAFEGECHRDQFATSVSLNGRTWTGAYADAPILRELPTRLDLAGVCSLGSEGADICGKTDFDLILQGHFPTPSGASESWYAELDGGGAGVRVSVRTDGRVALTYLDTGGATLNEIVSTDSVYGEREITAVSGTNGTTNSGLLRQYTLAELQVGAGHRFKANDLIRIIGDANFPNEIVLTETDPAAGWVRFLIFGGHDQTLPAVGADVRATGQIGVPTTTTGGSADIYADDRQGWLAANRWILLRITRVGDVVSFYARGSLIGEVTTPSLPIGPTSGVTSYLGAEPGSAMSPASGELIRRVVGSGLSAVEIEQAEARAAAVTTFRVGELDRRSYVDLSELPVLEREWMAHYPVEVAFRDLDTGEIIGSSHETTGQSYGRQTGLVHYVELGDRNLTQAKSYQCEVTVYDRPFETNGTLRTPAVLFHGAVATLERHPLDERWITRYVDPTHPGALDGINEGTDPEAPLATLAAGVRSLGIYTRVVMASVDYVALGATGHASGLDWKDLDASRITGPCRIECLDPTDYAEVGAWRLRAGSYGLVIHDFSSITEADFDGYVVQLGGAVFSNGSHHGIEVAHCRIRSNKPHCRIFGSSSLSLDWGGLDGIEHEPSATLAPVNSYGYYVERPVNHAAFNRMLIAIQNDTQHPLRVMGSHGLVLAHWPKRATTNYGASYRTVTLRQQSSLTNVHDIAFQGWSLWNSTEQWSVLPGNDWRIERTHYSNFQFTAASNLFFGQNFVPSNANNFMAIPTVGEVPNYLTRRRNVFLGTEFGDTVGDTIVRFDVWPTSGDYGNRQDNAGDYGAPFAPDVALAEVVGFERVALLADGYPQGGLGVTQPIRMQWQRRAADGSTWETLDGLGATYGVDRPGPGEWVYRTRTLSDVGTVLATGTESASVFVTDGSPMELQVNLSQIEYYTESHFVDAIKQGTNWGVQGPAYDPGDVPTRDANSYPIGMGTLGVDNYFECRPFLHNGERYPVGTYHCSFTGTGRVVVRHDGVTLLDTTVSETLHPVTISSTHNGGFDVRLYDVSAVDHITAVHLYLPGAWPDGVAFADSADVRPWAPIVVDRCKPFSGYRTMDPLRINSQTGVSDWADRRPFDAVQTTSRGVSPEMALLLAVQMGTDPWLCLPHLCTTDYAYQFGVLARSILGKRRVFLELSNEVWNSGFGQRTYFYDLGTTNYGGEWQREYAVAAVDRFEAFIEGFGSRGDVIRVCAWQNMDPYTSALVADYFGDADAALRGAQADGGCDAFSTAAYFGRDFRNDSAGVSDGNLPSFFRSYLPNEFLYRMGAEIPAIRAGLEWEHGKYKRLSGYEWGQHLNTIRGGVLDDALVALQNSNEMYDAYLGGLTWLETLGWDDLALYKLNGTITTSGAWGLVESLQDDPLLQAKYRACVDFRKGARLTIGSVPSEPNRPVWLGESESEVPGSSQIIDNGESGYAESGAWADSVVGGYGGSSRFVAAGSGSAWASWTFNVIEGRRYTVMTGWSPGSNRAVDTPYRIEGQGGGLLASRLINQQHDPQRYRAEGAVWHVLGVVVADGPTLTVRVTNDASGIVIADVCRIAEVF